MFPADNAASCVYVLYGDYVGVFDVSTGGMLRGDLPPHGCQMITEWLGMYRPPIA